MTDRQLFDYLVGLTNPMDLDCWRFILGPPLPEDGDNHDTLARIKVTYGQQEGYIQFSAEVGGLPRPRIRHCIVHELVHCHLNRIEVTARNATRRLGDEARAMAEDSIHDELEYAVDALTTAWAEALPLPPKTARGVVCDSARRIRA